MEYKYFDILKNDRKENENQPDYHIQVSQKLADGTYKNFRIASGWIKPMGDKKKISCKMEGAYVDKEGKTRPGFLITMDVPKADSKVKDIEYPKGEISAADIPF